MARESKQDRADRARRIARALGRAHPDARVALRHRNAFELLIATILSAQCTDAKVNEVTEILFERFPKPADLGAASPTAVEAIVRPTGFYRQKAKSIQATSRDLVERFGGEVPGTLEDLVTLRGVARKTANVVLGACFDVPGIAVDTHMKRVNQRLALTAKDDPEGIERDLMELLPRTQWTPYTVRVIHHGRVCCVARKPRCDDCPVRRDCPWPASQKR